MSEQETIGCKYSCHGCGLNEVMVQVAARTGGDVKAWMDGVMMPAIGRDHWNKSPMCKATVCDVMIPVNDKCKMIGEVVRRKLM